MTDQFKSVENYSDEEILELCRTKHTSFESENWMVLRYTLNNYWVEKMLRELETTGTSIERRCYSGSTYYIYVMFKHNDVPVYCFYNNEKWQLWHVSKFETSKLD